MRVNTDHRTAEALALKLRVTQNQDQYDRTCRSSYSDKMRCAPLYRFGKAWGLPPQPLLACDRTFYHCLLTWSSVMNELRLPLTRSDSGWDSTNRYNAGLHQVPQGQDISIIFQKHTNLFHFSRVLSSLAGNVVECVSERTVLHYCAQCRKLTTTTQLVGLSRRSPVVLLITDSGGCST